MECRREATQKLYDLCYAVGVRANAAVPLLIDRLADSDETIGDKASWGLRYCTPDSVEPLIDCLASADANVRRRACDALGNIGDEALPASDALRRLLADSVERVRTRAAWALGQVHDIRQATIGALSAMARRDGAADRAAALHALSQIGPVLADPQALRDMKPHVLQALSDEDESVRRSACWALRALHLEPKRHVDILMQRLGDESSPDIRYWLIQQLKDLAPAVDLSGHMPLMCDLVRAGAKDGKAMCELLGSLGPEAQAAVPTLLNALGHEDEYFVIAAAEALWAITGRADELLPALARIFDDAGEAVCDAIFLIGPPAAPLTGKLIEALASNDYWDLQWAAADALGAIACDDVHVMSALLSALSHPSSIVKSAAARALARVGPAAVPILQRILENRSDDRREWAADVLGRIGPRAAAAAPALQAYLRSDHAGLAAWTAVGLAKVTGNPVVIPILVELLGSERADLRREAAVALQAVGPPGLAALEALKAALDDEDPDVRAAAEDAIAALTGALH